MTLFKVSTEESGMALKLILFNMGRMGLWDIDSRILAYQA